MTTVRIPDDGGDTSMSFDVGGYIQAHLLKPGPEIQHVFDNVKHVQCRPDDVLLVTFPKSGTNWMYEMISMVLNKSAERVQTEKLYYMLDCQKNEDLAKLPSPRVLNTHYHPRFLPDDLKKKQVKTVLCVRNPKDTAVSYYCHMSGVQVYGYNGKWQNWIRPFMQGKFEYGHLMGFLNEWQEFMEDGPGFPIHVIYYEDLKKDGKHELDKLIDFLGVDLDGKVKHDIVEQCGFHAMKKDKSLEYVDKAFFQNGYSFFRKGEVGDWRNWFTLAQNDMFDEMWNQQIRADSMFHFKYE